MRMRIPLPAFAPSVLALVTAAVLIAYASVAAAQTPFVPYFGKNRIHYDNFEWHIYPTDHFEIYYYPELEQHLARIAGYAESAYQQISADLKHDLPFKVQLILFKTHSEFEQENIFGQATEGVGAFAEPVRQRMVMPIDEPPDRLYGLVVHELMHQFQFDIIPQSLVRRNYPLWVAEGGAEIERGQWTPMDLMDVRDAAVADIVPKMSETEGYGNANSARLVPYNLGHALFEFIEEKWGKEGIRQFMFSLRKSVIGGGEDAYEEAFKMKPRRIRCRLRSVPQGAVQAVPRQGAPGRLRPRSGAEPGAHAVHRRVLDRPVSLGRSARGRHRQPEGWGDRHRARLVEGRLDRPQSDQRVRQGHGLLPHRADGCAARDALDVVVAQGRPPRVLRPDRKGARAHRPERDLAKDRAAHPDEDGGRAGIAVLLARRTGDRVRGAPRRHRRHLHAGSPDQRDRQRHGRRIRRRGANLLARRHVPDLQRARQRQPEAVPARPDDEAEDADHVRNASTRPRRSSSTTTRSSSRRPPPIRPCRWIRRSPGTATSTTSGRSTCARASSASSPTSSEATGRPPC